MRGHNCKPVDFMSSQSTHLRAYQRHSFAHDHGPTRSPNDAVCLLSEDSYTGTSLRTRPCEESGSETTCKGMEFANQTVHAKSANYGRT